jgi:hypothetical protein
MGTVPTNGAPAPADHVVRASLTAADRQRRARQSTRQLWRVAPSVALGLLALAALSYFVGWSPLVPATALTLGFLAFVVFWWTTRRPHAISDAAAAAIDHDASMAGELRSAWWFAARDIRNEWAELHLERAASRVTAIDWKALYPSIRAPRAQAATALMTLAALALTITIPERVGARPAASAATAGRRLEGPLPRGPMQLLPPELQAQLEALLAAAEAGDRDTAEALASSAELREMLNKLSQLQDPKLLEALAKAMANRDTKASAAEQMKALADRARKAAESDSVSNEMKQALEKLADELDVAKPEQTASDEASSPDSPSGSQQGQSGQNAASGQQDVSIQFSKESDAAGAASMLMMSSPDAQQGSGPPGAGVGGSGSDVGEGTGMAEIGAALKQELIEASQDDTGKNVETEVRRKTEHGNATVGFTGSGSAKFDRSRAAAAPPLPEARRSGVQTYFVRKPQ